MTSVLTFGHFGHDVKMAAPKVEPLRAEHLDNLYETRREAFMNDPLETYLKANAEEPGPMRRATDKLLFRQTVKYQLKRLKVGYTLEAGNGAVMITPVESDISEPSPIDRLEDAFYGAIKFASVYFFTRERRKRIKELFAKIDSTTKAAFGDRTKEMISVDLLCVKPEKQGTGYGSALMNTICFMADLRGQSIYLFSSKESNASYYALFGFVTVGTLSLGGENPEWQESPVLLPLMVRKPRAFSVQLLSDHKSPVQRRAEPD